MSDDSQHKNIDSVIELAMSRLSTRSPGVAAEEDRRERQKLDLGRRDYDLALARRLEQMREVAGERPLAAPTAPVARGYGAGTLLLVAALAALAGSGTTWLALGEPAQPVMPVVVANASTNDMHAIAPKRAVPEPSVPPAPPMPSDEQQAQALVESWRAAWAGRDVDTYLFSYRADFRPADGKLHDAWAAARRKNISSRSNIAVAIHDLKLERLDGQRMRASFKQDYAAGSYRETAQPKTLLLVRDDAGWKIAGEWQGDMPDKSAVAVRR